MISTDTPLLPAGPTGPVEPCFPGNPGIPCSPRIPCGPPPANARFLKFSLIFCIAVANESLPSISCSVSSDIVVWYVIFSIYLRLF